MDSLSREILINGSSCDDDLRFVKHEKLSLLQITFLHRVPVDDSYLISLQCIALETAAK